MRFLQALVGPRMRSFLATVLLLALGFTVYYLAEDLSVIDALCRLTTGRTSTPYPRLIAGSSEVGVRVRVRVRVRVVRVRVRG